MVRSFMLAACLPLACAQPQARDEVPATVLVVASPPPGSEASARADSEPVRVAPRAPRPAPAREASPDALAAAKKAFQEGVRAFDEGRYSEARVQFARAYQIAPMPPVLYNLAMADLKDGDQQAACDHFREFKATGDPSRVAQAQKMFAVCPP